MANVLKRPLLATMAAPGALLELLAGFYDALLELRRAAPVGISTASTHAEVRRTVGSTSGPRLCIVTGRSSILDGGEAAYAWDPTSTAADDDAAVLAVFGVDVGRWRKCSL